MGGRRRRRRRRRKKVIPKARLPQRGIWPIMSFNIAALLAAFCYLGAPALDQPECYQAGGSCQGDLDSVLNGIESQNECLKNCRGRDKCEWYTHNSASRTCFLFRNCPDIDENCLNCLTGQKLCPYYPGKPHCSMRGLKYLSFDLM